VSIQPEEFLAQSPSAFLDQPSFLDSGPQGPPQAVEDTHPDYVKIGIGIAAALVVLRLLMKHEFSKEELLTDTQIAEAAARIYKRVIPAWLQAAVPAVLQAYQLGSTQQLTYGEMVRLATSYASELGTYVHETSTAALLDGFNAQVNSGWSANLAWQRSREAYGLDSRQMQSYVKGLTQLDKTGYVTDPVPAASRMFVDRAFLYRADRLGTTEAYKASRVGKNMVWMIMESTGQLPPGTMKKWITAEDELVCAVCGPLHGVIIGLDERFETLGGERFYAPVVHPNCRCDLELVYPDLGDDVVKSMPNDPFNRNEDGEFSSAESRKATQVTRVAARTVVRAKVRESRDEGIAVLDALATGTSALDALREADASALDALVSVKATVADATALNALLGTAEQRQTLTVHQHHERPRPTGEGAQSTDAWIPISDVAQDVLRINPSNPPGIDDVIDFADLADGEEKISGVEGWAVPHVEDRESGFGDIDDNPAFIRAFDDAMGTDQAEATRRHIANGSDGMGVTISDYGAIDGALDIYSDPVVGEAAEAFSGKEKPYLTALVARTLWQANAQAAASDDLSDPKWMKDATASEIAIEMTAAVNNERANDLGTWWQEAATDARRTGSYSPEDISISRYGVDEGSSRGFTPVFFRCRTWWGTDEGPEKGAGGDSAPAKAVAEGLYKVVGTQYLDELPSSVWSDDAGALVNRVLIIDLELLDAP